MRWVFASEDLASNIGVSCLIFGILLLIGEIWYDGLMTSGLVLTIVGAAAYYIRNKDEGDM